MLSVVVFVDSLIAVAVTVERRGFAHKANGMCKPVWRRHSCLRAPDKNVWATRLLEERLRGSQPAFSHRRDMTIISKAVFALLTGEGSRVEFVCKATCDL